MSAATAVPPADAAPADAAPPAAPPADAAPSSSGGGAAAAPMGIPAGAAQGAFHSASLYVGDLAPDVNEGLLFEIFNAVGPVSSIRVCRDAVTRRSLGYAYVNFHQVADAERALDTMNFTTIKDRPCRIMWSQRDPSIRRSNVGNIFVKNLHESIDNKQLYDTFSLFGNILSCKVVTDRDTGKSKGYGYVHYETAEAAQAAIEKLDGMLIDGQEVQVGVFMRRTERPGQADWTNLYLKNIPREWDDARLKEEFSKFGEVVSATHQTGIPKKPFRKPAPPKKEEEGEKPAEVEEGEEKPSAEEEGEEKPSAEEGEKKEGEEKPDEEKPAEEGEKKEGEDKKEGEEKPSAEDESKEEEKKESEPPKIQPLGFGFVNYAEHEGAVAAIEEMNGREFTTFVDGEEVTLELFVGRAQKKSERERELRAKFEAEKMERISKFQGVNLYVKNLDDGVTDDMLRTEFATMGTITSARVMKDLKDGRSRGFGFVCYSTPEEATRAVNEMNGKLVGNKPIFVALAQRKEVRRAQLEARHATRGMGGGGAGGPGGMMRGGPGGMGGGPGMGGGGYPQGGPGMPMYMQRPGGAPGGMQPAYPMMGQPMMGGPGGRGPGRPGGYPMMQGGQQRAYPMPQYGGMPPQQGGRGRGPQGRGGRGGRGGPQQMQGRGSGPGRGGPQGAGQPGIKFNQQVRNQPGGAPPPPPPQGQPQQAPIQQAPPPTQQGGPAPGQAPPAAGGPPPQPNEALTASALASASPEMQKNMIGERLYPLIHHSQPDLAGKITGMLLEMDNSELLHLLESPDALGAKISEAIQVLEVHNSQQQTATGE
eukprot:CAMPEP_0113538264 /NCGR_PEP_ID=MMETSP0015_2-20120614/7270_1 /TAXON_ID=2838 /ORGANISM="Odontella" /LENGTH=817 /DNA_ID=CAMNT_0000437821 /DNA_START=317 /DNA_END=2770 /DNA_ORIENTATION=- /assembly_acc=CAM_ASM_000160